MLRLLCLVLALCAAPAVAQTVTFSPATEPVVNPDRGWWEFAGNDFRTVREADLRDMRQRGLTVTYAVVRLDGFRNRRLSAGFLADLGMSFDKVRATGMRVILRFAYNYPQSSQEYKDAKDAPLDIVLQHIAQLKPVLRDNADLITVMQAGFIGAWGEGHTSSNGLNRPLRKAVIRDALLGALPSVVPLQWRYPADLIDWADAGDIGRFGLHNDCFLSSPTDVGSYAEKPSIRAAQRAKMMALTADTYFSGETCDAEPGAIRKGCGPILEEGPQFHLSALGLGYYTEFHKSWRAGGCFGKITDKMGYRLRLIAAEVAGDRLEVTLVNEGWAALSRPRVMKLRVENETPTTFGGNLADIAPGETVTVSAALPAGLVPARLCLIAPDPSPRLARDKRYAIRFANATVDGATWKEGAFCFDSGA